MRNTDFRYRLEPYRGAKTRHTCPSCGHKGEFTYYIDAETNEPIHETCGRCNRESCGYHLTPAEYFKQNGINSAYTKNTPSVHQCTPPKEKPVSYLPREIVAHDQHRESNNLYRFLAGEFGAAATGRAFDKYYVSTSRHWRNDGGYSTVFPQIDEQGRVHQVKVMAYSPDSGKRMKKNNHCELWSDYRNSYVPDTRDMDRIFFAGKSLFGDQEATFQQCFFGQHLVSEAQRIGIAESEKTALICAIVMPDITWLATGGCNGCRWTEPSVYGCLVGKRVVLFPDGGQLAKWKERAELLRKGGVHATTSPMCESLPANTDIADLLLDERRASRAMTLGEVLAYANSIGVLNRIHVNL